MELNERIEQLKLTLKTLRALKTDASLSKEQSDSLDVAISLAQNESSDLQHISNQDKFYAPVWVDALLCHAAEAQSKGEKLNEELVHVFKPQVQLLQMSDYKVANPSDLNGYKVVYSNPQEITETIMALKHYFGLV